MWIAICDAGKRQRCFIDENTLIAIAGLMCSGRTPENTVSNLSSSRGLRDVTEKHNSTYHAAAVGEVNVVTRMKEVDRPCRFGEGKRRSDLSAPIYDATLC